VKFTELQLAEPLLEAISYMGFDEATPIQQQAIPHIIAGHDLLACAQTGTGKTAAFMLPVLSQLSKNKSQGIKALIVVPTRELALQIDQQIQGFSYFLPFSSIAIYGGGDGKDWASQKSALSSGVDVVVATPGKMLSHLAMNYVNLTFLKHFILDEADRMLDMGFTEDLAKIMSYLPEKRQNLLFSATMPPKIRDLAKKMLYQPKELSLSVSKPAEGVAQSAYMAYDEQKPGLLCEILKDTSIFQRIIIFTSSKKIVFDLVRMVSKFEKKVEGVSSDFDQKEREAALQRFTTAETRVLVATDVLSRGIDIKEIDLVVNYDVPGNAEDYVHRVGRTARSKHKGAAITFINPRDCYKFAQIEALIGYAVNKMGMPESLGVAPEWRPESRVRNTPNRNRKPSSGASGGQANTHAKPKPKYRKNPKERGKHTDGSAASDM
jgi:superfamily II DNA/RNA helicase